MQTSFSLLNQLVDGSRVETCARATLPLIGIVDLIETLLIVVVIVHWMCINLIREKVDSYHAVHVLPNAQSSLLPAEHRDLSKHCLFDGVRGQCRSQAESIAQHIHHTLSHLRRLSLAKAIVAANYHPSPLHVPKFMQIRTYIHINTEEYKYKHWT